MIHSFVGITSGQSSDVAGAMVEEDGTIASIAMNFSILMSCHHNWRVSAKKPLAAFRMSGRSQ